MARATAKRVLMGYGLWLKRHDDTVKWDRVGGLFLSKLEAERYLKNNYRTASKYRIEGIRLSAEPIAPRETSRS